MVSESVSQALAKSDKRAVRIAEADAGLGDKSEESNFTEKKQVKLWPMPKKNEGQPYHGC